MRDAGLGGEIIHISPRAPPPHLPSHLLHEIAHMSKHLSSLHSDIPHNTLLDTVEPEMSDINASDLPLWRGPFSWDGLLLRLHIRTIQHDYDAEDPRTWPLIKDVVQTEVNYDYRQTKPAPRFLAYEQSLVENLITHRPLVNKVSCRPNMAGRQIKVMFADYPYNFDRFGELRDFPHLPEEELKEWTRLMKGASMDGKYISAAPSQSIGNIDRHIELQKGKPSPCASPVEHAAGSITEQDAAPSITLLKLQNELNAMQRQLQITIETTMNTHIAECNKALHAATQKTRALELLINDQHHEAEKRTSTSEDKISNLEEQLEKQKEELEVAKKETARTNEAIVWVWNEVQRLSKAVARKRKGGDDEDAERQKKIKVEEER